MVKNRANKAIALLNKDEEPDNDLSEHCTKPYECAFLDYCKRQHGVPDDKPTVFNLYRMTFAQKLEHYHAGRLSFEDVRNQKLSDKQQMQVECTLNKTEHIDTEGIRKFLSQLSYPLYFLDFETLMQTVPQYDGQRPYQQITFQYSLHIKGKCRCPLSAQGVSCSQRWHRPTPGTCRTTMPRHPYECLHTGLQQRFRMRAYQGVGNAIPRLGSASAEHPRAHTGPVYAIPERVLLCTCNGWIVQHQECVAGAFPRRPRPKLPQP